MPVGASLVARDNLVSTVRGLATKYRSRAPGARTQALRARGATARNRFERQVRRTRTKVERELRQRRSRVERTVHQNRRRLEREVRAVRKDFEQQSGVVTSRAQKLVPGTPDASVTDRLINFPRAGPERPGRGKGSPAHTLAGECSTLSSLNRRGATKVAPRRSLRVPAVSRRRSPARSWMRHRRQTAGRVCQNGTMPTRDQVLDALRAVIDPELRRDIVELEMVRSIDVHDNGVIDVMVSLTTPGCPIRSHFQTGVAKAVRKLEGVPASTSASTSCPTEEKQALGRKLGRGALPEGALAQVENVICVGSGKGGVGKSSVTANLAAALAADGKKVGVLDADVWGYSQPRMLGLGAERPKVNAQRKLVPLTAQDGIKVMSIGFFVEEDAAVVWRGPMLHKALQQFLEDVEWGELDYLLIDLPPGTGDVSMTLAQLLPQAKFLIVTTPQPVAQRVARRSAEMASKVKLEIAGVIENMSGFVTPGGERFQIFGEGGGQLLADELDVPLLGKVPLTMPLREQSDGGVPAGVLRSGRPRRPGAPTRPPAG